MAIIYSDLAGPNGDPNVGGFKDFVLWAAKGDLATVAGLSTAPAALKDLVEISTDHTFQSTKKMWKVYCTTDKTDLEAAIAGDLDGKVFNPQVTIFYPGIDTTALGFITQWTRDAGLLFVPLLGDNGASVYMQIGMEDMWARVTAGKFGSAKNGEGVRGTELTISSFQPNPLIYTGALQLTPAI